MFDTVRGDHFARMLRPALRALVALITLAALAVPGPAFAQTNNPSGLKLPRFVTTRSSPVNVRVGPGEKYEIAWIFLKDRVPVEIIAEFDTWRKIRDVDGAEGWVHQNLLQGPRAGYVSPVQANGTIALRASAADDSAVRATLGAGLLVTIRQCDGLWCEVTASQEVAGERPASYSGFLHQEELWGVYPDEIFD
ncbi:SH3 domain-containing protein [uncultured Devosia sp.]|uniref:SH3 domain-containing protein n=1 Tax=uncultured Devosia sp. TaxID=211434 RepID=UPI0035CC6BA5